MSNRKGIFEVPKTLTQFKLWFLLPASIKACTLTAACHHNLSQRKTNTTLPLSRTRQLIPVMVMMSQSSHV